jgi:ubiquinone/menaquinone biosynthesis C-methylase UbiE
MLFQGLSGRVLDAGVGTGRNFPYYPPSTKVVGIDISPAMLTRAERKRKSAAADIQLKQMDVTRLSTSRTGLSMQPWPHFCSACFLRSYRCPH